MVLFLKVNIMVIFMNERNLKECCQTKLSWESLNGCIAHKIEEAECSVCDTTYRRRNTGAVLYVKEQNDEDFFCGTCGSEIKPIKVVHPVHRPSHRSDSGRGRCKYEEVQYCPHCEVEPRSIGRSYIIS